MWSKHVLLGFFVPALLAACSRPVPGARAHDDSVAGHRRLAARHQIEVDNTRVGAHSSTYFQSVHQEHKTIAAAHLRAATQLEAEYTAACANIDPGSATVWTEVQSTGEVPGGAVLHIAAAAGSKTRVQAKVECHRATLARDGFDNFLDDPLAVDDLDVNVHAEPGGTAIMLRVDGAATVAELRRRISLLTRTK